MKNVKLVDNSNVIDSKKPDFVKLGFSDGAMLEAPIGYSKPYEKIDVLHSFMGGNKKDFDASVGVMRQARESGDETLKLGAILNAITALDPSLGDVPNDYIIETFMGVGKTAKDAEQYLEDISKLTEQSDENALADFDKLGADEQRKRVEANSSDLKRNKTVTGIYGIQTTVTEDNPDFDYEKAKAEYRDMLEARNTFKTFAKLRNAGFDNRVIRDVIRFKTAFETRNAAADVYAENILTEDEEYVKQFMAAVNAFSPEVRRGFFDRVITRIAEDSGDSWGNIKDYLLDSNSYASIFYEQAKKMNLIDKDGNLVDDEKKITIIKNFLADKNAAAQSYGFYGMFRDFDAQKLFNEGKRQFERRKLVRELMNANRTRFEKSGAVSETLEEALVNGFVSLEYLGLTFGISAATGNPLAGVAASSAMMYLDEASNMYEDLRYDGNVDEATAAAASALYGVVASGLEQVQVRGLGRVFVGKKASYSNFREYVAHGIKESLKDLGKEAVVQTATELATSVDAYMTKKFAADFADATYDEEELFNEFRDECSMLIKTMPLITLGFWGAGAPYRARAHLGEVGAKIGSGVKAIFSSAEVLNNNAKSLGVIKLGEEYEAQIKSKYGRTERGREFLSKFLDAKDAAQRDSVLAEYYPDAERREEVKLELEAADKATKEAKTEVIKRGLEIAKKRMEDDAALQNGDTVDISVLDGKDENGEYAVLESAIDSFGMRENVVFVESAQELSDVSGVSLKTAEEQMSRKGAMGFTSMSNGKIIILKPHLRNGADALQTFVHEYGHKIMKSIRTNDLGGYNRMCDDVLDILGGEGLARMMLPESYSNEKSIQYIADSRAVAEEILMRVVERVATKKAVDAKSRGVWARVKAWFNSLFDEKTLAEIADEKLAQMALDVLQREKKFEVNAGDIKPSNRWRAKTPENNGEEVSGEWQVVDASELLTSTDEGFDDKLQPRNRSRQASKEQTSDIAVNLDPERLNDSVTSDLGAPIVDSRGMVLSGNGRTLAIRQAYASEKSERADAYRQFVERRAREMGIEIPDNVKNPVLVRRVDDFGKMSAEEFAARSNKSQVAGMSVAEQAIADGRRILAANLLDYFFPDANGNVLASSNTDFVNAFLEQVGGSEMYRNSDGSIRSNLSPRIKAAVLAAMLDSDNRETVERLLDNPEGFNALVGGLMQSAANLAELSGKPEYDISEELSQAVELFVEMRNKGMKLADFSAQGDFFRAAPSDEVMFLMGLFEENSKTPSGISGVLRQYAGECKKIDTTTMDMFGTENPSKIEKLEQARDHYAADIAQQDANADLRGKYEEEGPSDAEIKEFERQIKEVKAKWTNPDGTMKKGYHCAPNGKPSKLSEEQWLWVRTPNFKRWFGDWEKRAYAYAAMDFLENTAPVKELSGQEFQKDGVKLTEKVPAFFDSINNVAHNEELGDVVLDLEGVKDSISHGVGRLKSAAFMAVPDVIEKGFIFNRETNWKERNYNTAVIVAPIKIGAEDYICEVIVKRDAKRTAFYLHEVEIKRTLEDMFKTTTEGAISQASKLILGKHLAEVKGNVSQVVDENGEPLVVYHGTENGGFTVFDKDLIASEGGFYFNDRKAVADEYAATPDGHEPLGESKVYSVFLNMRNPYIKDFKGERYNEFWTEMDVVKEDGYDGFIAKNIVDNRFSDSENTIPSTDYIVLDSTQVKSATENVGTFSENPDIRWSIREDSELEKINTQHRELYERYKNGEVSAENLQKEIDDFMGDFQSERTPERKIIEYATPKEKIYNIDEAVDFVRKNLLNKPINNYVEQEGKIVSATISRNCLDKINSGKARGKTNNNRLYALAVANIDRLFTLSNRLESEPPKNGSPELKAVHRHYAPLLMDGKVYAVKLTVKEFDEKTGNRIYSIEGIDVNGESDLSGLSKNGENSNSSAAIQRSDSVKEFIDKIRNVNKKFYDLAREKISNKAYEEAAKLVADYAKSKGYDVKVYHGTGADGFNVAKADASEAQNGEGAQAHGMGLYLAVMRQTAEGYRDRAPMQERHTIGGKTFEELGLTREKLNHPVIGLVQVLHSRGVEEGKKIINVRIENQTKRLESAEKHLQKADDEFVKELSQQTIDNAKKEIASDRKTLNTIDKILSILEENGLSISDYEYTFNKGKVFDWRTNLAKENTLDEQLPFSKQNKEVQEKIQAAIETLPTRSGRPNPSETFKDLVENDWDGKTIYDEIVEYTKSKRRATEHLIDHGIKGIVYDGRQDGRCYVSFEGGAAVKFQDPFTFDDNGELIPLSERFDEGNPDMRWKDDTVLMPIDINVLVARNIDALMNAIRKSHKSVLSKKAELDKKYPDDDKDSRHGKITELRDFILDNFSSELVPIAKLSDEDFKFYRKQFGIRDRFVYTSFGYAIEHYFNRHPDTPIENYLLLPDTIINPDKKKEVGKWIKDELGEWIYDASQAFVKEYDKWHLSTIKVDTQLTPSGKKLIAFKNFYGARKEPYGNKKTIEDYWKNATSSSKVIRRQAKISTLNNFNRQGESSTDGVENQEKNSRLRFLLRQERTENPVIWASIVLAKEIYLGRKITASKLETVLPSAKFDGTKREYAVARAKEIANRYKINKEKFGEKLDVGLQRAENDLYWRRDVMDEMYASFRADGEEYGYIKARLKEWLKNERRRDLEKIRGLKPDEIGFDVADAIENAMDAEPERPKPSEKKLDETDEEELEEIESSGSNDAEVPDKLPSDERFDTRGVVAKIRMATTKIAKQKDLDEPSRRRLYRNTLVETLTDAAKKLSFGIERERILGKIAELAGKPYVAIKIKDGDRAGQIVDNYTLRAEHIAMRIFNRGVWDSKKAMLEKFESIVKRIKAPKRVERDDKRSMTGKAQERAYLIRQIAYMPLNSDDKTIKSVEGEIENALTAINRADSSTANDYHAKLMDAVQYLEDLQRFGALREKNRAEMAEAVDWLEKYLEDETAAQEKKVEKLKADATRRRKIFVDAISEISRNAAFDGKARESLRLLFNSASTFKDLLLGLGRAATGEKYREFKGLVDSMMDACYAATAQKENEVFRLQEELTKAVSEIYGMKPTDAFKHILGANAELQKFSVQGKPMSVQIALQRLSEAEQGNYQNNVFQHCVSKSEEVKTLEEQIAELNGEEPTEAVRTQIAEMELRLQSLKRDAVERYAEELRGALSEQDLRLLDWFREFYRRERPSLSNANEIITGLGIPEVDPFYTPMKMLREGGTNEKHQVVAIVPKSLSPRVPNSLDIDESFGIVDIWNDRVNENAHYKAFSQLNIEWRGIFAHADFHKAVAAKLGKDVLTQVLDHFNDIMSVNLGSGLKIDTIDKLNGVYAIAALGFNLGSGLRQMTGVPAFANFIGVKKSLEYAKSCLSKDGRRAAVEILNSETAKRRMQSGNNQILVEALNNIDGNKFWGWYKRNAMFFNKWGDIIPIITIGQGIYRSKTEEYAKTMPIDDAKKKAMDEMWAIAESSQQSPSVMNMGTWQRRGGSFGKMAGLFISSPQLMLSREIEAFNRFNEVRKKYRAKPKDAAVRADYLAARRELAKTFLINHVFVQGGYMLATVLWKGLLGDDWDDDDWAAIIAESVAGPFGGLVVFGRFVSAIYSNYSVSVAPIEGFGRTLKSSADLFLDLIRLDGDEVLKDLDRMGKSLFSPYRDASKLYKNATDDKEGMFW